MIFPGFVNVFVPPITVTAVTVSKRMAFFIADNPLNTVERFIFVTYPKVESPSTVLAILNELTYQFPKVSNLLLSVAVLTYPNEPRPVTVLLKSVRVLAYPSEPRPATVLNSDVDVTYPKFPRLVIVLMVDAVTEPTAEEIVELLAN